MNKPFIFAVVMSLCALMCQPAFANPPADTITVLADGTGQTADEALKNAFKNAVYKAVGVYVLTETSSTDDNIKDKVFLNSDAVVKSHQVIKSGNKDGKYTVVIRANVMKNEIAAKIKAVETTSQISQTDVLSTVNSLDAMDEAAKAFHVVMADFPQNVMDITPIGKPVIDGSKKMNGNEIHMLQKIRISINSNKYAQLMEKVKKIFAPFVTWKNDRIIDFSMRAAYQGNVIFLSPRSAKKKYKSLKQQFSCSEYKVPDALIQKTFLNAFFTHSYRAWASTCYVKTFSIEYSLYDVDNQLIFSKTYNITKEGKETRMRFQPSYTEVYINIVPAGTDGRTGKIRPIFLIPTLRGAKNSDINATLHFTIDKNDFTAVRKFIVKAVKFQRSADF